MKNLFIPLKAQFFNEFKAGIKKTEYRLYGARWNEQTIIPGRGVTLSYGYSGERLYATVIRLRKIANENPNSLYPLGVTLAAIDLLLD